MDVTRRAFAFFGATALGSVAMGGRAFADDAAELVAALRQKGLV